MMFRRLSLPLLLFVVSCSSQHVPAPVVNLGNAKERNELKKGTLKAKKYIVKKGDTLYSIAFESDQNYQDIAKWNSISEPYSIYPGQELNLVASKSRHPKKTPKNPTKKTKTEVNQTVDPPKKQAYGSSKSTRKSRQSETFPREVARWQWPAKGQILSKFSLSEQGNKGVDVAGTKGDPVYAAADGKVVYTGNALRGYGNLVIVKHTDSYLSAYAHNDKILVKERQWVKAGQRIAQMGSTGTDRTKLHFEVRYKGKSVDPLRYLPK